MNGHVDPHELVSISLYEQEHPNKSNKKCCTILHNKAFEDGKDDKTIEKNM